MDQHDNPRKSRHPRTAAVVLAGLLVMAPHYDARAAGLLIADGGFGGVLEITEHAAHVTVNNGIAVTTVTQVFRNQENRQVEALFVFPVPQGASVSNFSMWIDGQEMVGEVVEKQRARQIYNSYKQRRRDPGLLEQADYKTFEMCIFPIAPEAEQKVMITYYQELDCDHDWVTYVYPLATKARPGLNARTTGAFSFNLEAKSEVPITVMESPSHGDEFVIAKHREGYHQASLEAAAGDLNRDVTLAYRLSRPHTGVDLIASRPGDEDGYFALTLTAGEELAGDNAAMDYVFILDISGSMANDGKLKMSRDSIGAFVDTLGAADRLEIITFNVTAQTLFDELRQATDEHKSQAVDFLSSQRAKGGTVLRPALQAAYRYGDPDRPLNVVVLSDGMTKQGERATLLEMIEQRPAGTRVFCVGVGNEVNRPLLEQLAEDAGGLAAFISHGDNFARQAQAFRRKLTHPVAGNLRIDFSGAEVYDVEPRKLPDLFHGTPLRLYGRLCGEGPLQVTIQGDVQGAELRQVVKIDLATVDSDNPQIERMWAWHRVQSLLKQADRSGSRSAVVDEIVRLGEAYSIATEYTSFLVLENDAEYRRWKIDRRNALRVQRDRSAHERLTDKLAALRDQALADLGPPSAVQQPAPGADPTVPRRIAHRRSGAQLTQGPERRSRGWDIDFIPNGGGALDPVGGGLLLAMAGLAWVSRRGTRNPDNKE